MNKSKDKNIFMMCEKLNYNALSEMPSEFIVRNCRKDEIDIWKAMPFDEEESIIKNKEFMDNYFNQVYKEKKELFYQRCLFVCNEENMPLATCFIWKAYNKINTIHWLKVKKDYEGLGIGRALLSIIMKDLKECLPILNRYMPKNEFEKLEIRTAPKYFVDIADSSGINEF